MNLDLHELIALHDQGDPELTADAVFEAVACPAKWRIMFGALLRDECRRSLRADARKIEEEASGGHRPSGAPTTPATGGPSRTDFLATRFYTGSRYVRWGEATVEDHRERIAYLGSLRNGIDVTIQRHADAIEQIEAAGASTLNDLGRAVAA